MIVGEKQIGYSLKAVFQSYTCTCMSMDWTLKVKREDDIIGTILLKKINEADITRMGESS